MNFQRLMDRIDRLGLVMQIVIGLMAGVAVGAVTRAFMPDAPGVPQPEFVTYVGETGKLLGGMFVGALKAVAPVLVFFLLMAAVSQHRKGNPTNIRS